MSVKPELTMLRLKLADATRRRNAHSRAIESVTCWRDEAVAEIVTITRAIAALREPTE